ncbi:MAG: beta-lactamase family protein, partial [Candidatus Thermoplasmatota archaeon]|nr:beta-lactamase family protein [Candidatus Thermoplasmatota archaeon]
MNLRPAFERIDKYVKQWMDLWNIPGLGVSITDRKRLLRQSTYGYSDIESGFPVRPNTMWEIGSISKSFASIVLMQLHDEHKVDLHRPVIEYLPWFSVKSKFEPITLHHLLTHTAGIIMGTECRLSGVPEVLALAETETSTSPGEHFYYSNVGYKVVGLVIEELLGKSCDKAIQERVFDPLGMNTSVATITHDIRKRLAVCYLPFYDDRPSPIGGPLVRATRIESDTADGSICSTPSDMATYMRMLMNRGKCANGMVISDKGFKLLTQKAIFPDDDLHKGAYGYGISIEESDGHTYVGHTGGMVGHTSSIRMDMDDGFGVGAFTNVSNPAEVDDVARFALSVLRTAAAGMRLPEVPRLSDKPSVGNAGEYSGLFDGGSRSLRVKAGSDRLFLNVGKKDFAMEKRENDAFLVNHPSFDLFMMRFERENGKVVRILHGQDVYEKHGRVNTSKTRSPKGAEEYEGHYRSYNPWFSNFRVISRKGELVYVDPSGKEQRMTRLPDGSFRIGDAASPERVRFDCVVCGKASHAVLS